MPSRPFANPPISEANYGNLPSTPQALSGGVPAFRTPSLYEENGYVDSPVGAYAPGLRPSASDATPDTRRLGVTPITEYRPQGAQPPEQWWLGPTGPGANAQGRHNSAETVQPVPQHEHRDPLYATRKRAAPDQRRTPPAETRMTSDMRPSNYTFTRPFAQETPHRFSGIRFSMADHRRRYDGMENGMAPQITRRNTYRRDPGPWDQNMTDYGDNTPADWGGYHTAAIPTTRNRSGRLDAY